MERNDMVFLFLKVPDEGHSPINYACLLKISKNWIKPINCLYKPVIIII